MRAVKLKVCGMRNPANIEAVNEIGPDYMGFIFYSKSPRYVGQAFSHRTQLRATPVGVFVNETAENIARSLSEIGSTTAQLHGGESPDDCEKMRDLGFTVIKAIPVGPDFDPKSLVKYQMAVDYFLFDTKGKLFGGNATKFDWTLLERYDQDVPFFLSGGIGIDDLAAIEQLRHDRLHAVDLNSGVEISPGLKDPVRVKRAKEIISGIK